MDLRHIHSKGNASKYTGMETVRCKSCGTTMGFPTKRVKLVYRYCTYCQLDIGELTYNDSDEGIYCEAKEDDPNSAGGLIKRLRLVIRAAAWGHPRDGAKSIDVTDKVQKMVDEGTGDSLIINAKKFKPLKTFGDPYEKGRKQLTILTRYGDRYCERYVMQGKGDRLKKSLKIVPPFDPWLFIIYATYGHRADPRCQYNVTEKLQARIDDAGGRYLGIPGDEDVANWFGDPYPGGRKHLIIDYEMGGWLGDVTVPEAHGHVLEPLTIIAPMVTPQLKINYARFGMLKPLKEQSLLKGARPKFVDQYYIGEVTDINKDGTYSIKFDDGDFKSGITSAQIRSLDKKEEKKMEKKKPKSINDIEIDSGGFEIGERVEADCFSNSETLTLILQKRADYCEGERLEITTEDNMIEIVGKDPCPGLAKVLYIEYTLREHAGKAKIRCDTSGHLVETLSLETPAYKEGGERSRLLKGNNMLVAPGVNLKSAGFGHPSMDSRKGLYDITSILTRRLDRNKGKLLHVPRSEDLEKSFGNPCRGVFKNLFIRYQMPMWMQTLEVEGIGRRLQATVRLGWPGDITVSPKPKDVPLKTKGGQGWSTRWKGDFDENALHASRHEIAMEKKRKIEAAHKALQLKIAMQKRKEREAILAKKGKLLL